MKELLDFEVSTCNLRVQAMECKDAMATKASQSVVGLLDQFDGRNISKYLKYYSREMELNKVSEKDMILTFELAIVPKLREHIKGIFKTHGEKWEDFILQLKEEYSLEDAERVELFLQSAGNDLQRELELLLEDNTEDNGLTSDWKKVSEAVGILAKREYRRGKVVVRQETRPSPTTTSRRQQLEPAIPVRPIPIPMSTVALQKDAIDELAMTSREAITYGIDAVREKEDVFDKYINTRDLWNHAIINMNKGKIIRQELLNTATIIRNATGWDDPVDTMSVHAYLAKSQHEALLEVKRGRNEIEENPEEPTNKRRSQRHAETAQNKEIPIPHVNRPSKAGPSILHPGNASLPKKKWEERIEVDKDKGKNKHITYKLQSDIEAATDLKGVLEERILNAKIEFTLREILGITKRDFHEVIIDTKEESELVECCINKKGQFNLDEYKDDDKGPGHYIKGHWTRATIETLVKMEDLEEPVIALIDHGSEINIMSKEVYKHTTSYPVILGQPYITAVRMETKVLDDGSACARTRRQDGKKVVQFLTVPANHERNRNYLRSELLPRVSEEFTDFCKWEKKVVQKSEKDLKRVGVLDGDDKIIGVYMETGLENFMEELLEVEQENEDQVMQVHSRELYSAIQAFQDYEVEVETKYKTVEKKIKPVAIPLPSDSNHQVQ
uniref:Predicted protein n=1 Tax=Physcomitrium patens TaxID=3218 RepID=A9U4P9_PHYPA